MYSLECKCVYVCACVCVVVCVCVIPKYILHQRYKTMRENVSKTTGDLLQP